MYVEDLLSLLTLDSNAFISTTTRGLESSRGIPTPRSMSTMTGMPASWTR